MFLSFPPNLLFYIIIETLLGISLFIMVIISIIGYNSLHFSGRAIGDINQNWKKSPISDIVSTDGTCPLEYQSFISDYWEGTVAGCDCTNLFSTRIPAGKKNKLNSGSCTYNMTIAGCTQISSIAPMKYSKWKNKKLCVKKETLTYDDYLKNSVATGKSCKNGYKQCGTIDSTGNVLCSSQNQECPINKIVVQKETDSIPQDYEYKKLPLSDNTILYFTNKAINNMVYLDFKISEGLPCVDPEQKNSNKTQYVLDPYYDYYGCTHQIGNYFWDNRYSVVDSINKRRLYDENNILSQLLKLPHYPEYILDVDINLYNRPFIGWKLSCLNDQLFDKSLIGILSEKINGLISMKMTTMIMSIITFGYGVFQCIFKYVYFRRKDIVLGFNVLETIFLLLNIVVFILALASLFQVGNYSTQLKGFNCSDSITNAMIDQLGLNFSTNLWYDGVIAFLSILAIPGYLVYLIIQVLTKSYRFSSNPDFNTELHNESTQKPHNDFTNNNQTEYNPYNNQNVYIPNSQNSMPQFSQAVYPPQNSQIMETPYNNQNVGVPYNSQNVGIPYNSQNFGVPYNNNDGRENHPGNH